MCHDATMSNGKLRPVTELESIPQARSSLLLHLSGRGNGSLDRPALAVRNDSTRHPFGFPDNRPFSASSHCPQRQADGRVAHTRSVLSLSCCEVSMAIEHEIHERACGTDG